MYGGLSGLLINTGILKRAAVFWNRGNGYENGIKQQTSDEKTLTSRSWGIPSRTAI
jgi:hypothetical protein